MTKSDWCDMFTHENNIAIRDIYYFPHLTDVSKKYVSTKMALKASANIQYVKTHWLASNNLDCSTETRLLLKLQVYASADPRCVSNYLYAKLALDEGMLDISPDSGTVSSVRRGTLLLEALEENCGHIYPCPRMIVAIITAFAGSFK
jgi:hypothetical protein